MVFDTVERSTNWLANIETKSSGLEAPYPRTETPIDTSSARTYAAQQSGHRRLEQHEQTRVHRRRHRFEAAAEVCLDLEGRGRSTGSGDDRQTQFLGGVRQGRRPVLDVAGVLDFGDPLPRGVGVDVHQSSSRFCGAEQVEEFEETSVVTRDVLVGVEVWVRGEVDLDLFGCGSLIDVDGEVFDRPGRDHVQFAVRVPESDSGMEQHEVDQRPVEASSVGDAVITGVEVAS